MKLNIIKTAKELEPYLGANIYRGFSARTLEQQSINAHFVVTDESIPVARCSLWWKNTPEYQNHRPGLIGHYAAQTDAAAEYLLKHALSNLADQNCSLAIGPMDGNTWRSYRFVTAGSVPPFFLEPTNPASYPAQWQKAGFEPLAEYFSALQTSLDETPGLSGKITSLEQKGIRIRHLNQNQIDTELESIYTLSLQSFAGNFLYTPLDKKEFTVQYQQILPYIQPELVLMAEHKQKVIAFLFALPDLSQKQRGEVLDTFIIKTLATHPDYTGQGIGSTLAALALQNARKMGFQKAIHALMLRDNISRKISAHYNQEELRRYTLFAKPL